MHVGIFYRNNQLTNRLGINELANLHIICMKLLTNSELNIQENILNKTFLLNIFIMKL